MTWLPKEMCTSESKEQCIIIAPHFQAMTRPNELKRQHRIRDYASVLSCALAVRGVPHMVQANPKADRLEERKQYELFQGIVAAAAAAPEHAIALYQEQPLDYAKMIYSGYEILERFSWDRTIASYKRHLYDAAEQ